MPASSIALRVVGTSAIPRAIAQPVEETRLAGERALGPVRGDRRVDHVLAVAGHDQQAAGPDPLQQVARLHRADGHVLDRAVQVGALVEHLAGHLLDQHRQRRVGEQRPVREACRAARCRAGPGRAAGCPGRLGCASASTLLTTAPTTSTPWRAKRARLSTISSIGPADARLADDHHRGTQHAARHRRWRGR